MTREDTVEVLKDIDGVFEVFELVARYKLYRKARGNDVQKVYVEIFGAGPDTPSTRYHAVATTNDGRSASGDDDSSIEAALRRIQWKNLDEPA